MAEEDLIFGKNRHLFGGIEPSNMAVFSGAVDSTLNKIKITATLPDDTVIDGQVLCSIAGAVIRRKVGNYPADEFDGYLIGNITNSSVVVDQTADPTATYYYAAFPYSEQGVYNRNKANRVVVNEPPDMTAFNAVSIYDPLNETSTVQITADLPVGVAGAVIRRSTSGYPQSETDGDAFQNIVADSVLIDANVVIGMTYYYAAFPYSSNGAYNRSGNNQASVVVTAYEYLFGYDLVPATSDPNTRVTYPNDVDNAEYVPAAMNFATGVFGYGDWPSAAGSKFMPKPCMLTFAGQVDHYLDPDDYTKQEDGVTTSSVASTAFGGNAMMEWPKIFTKRWTDENGVYHFRCSDIAFDDDWDCWCNYDRMNNQIDHFYTPIFFGSNISSKMRSISGQANYVSAAADAEINAAKANGNDWYTEVLSDRLLIQDLLTMMAKSTAHQEKFGYGRCKDSNTAAIGQGTMNTKGLFWGDDDQTSGVKVFGMENWWGNLWRRTAGWINANGTQKIKITRGTHDGSTADDYNTSGANYLTVSGATPSGTSGGYISACKNLQFGRIPFQASGASSTYEADGLWFNNAQVNYATVGGRWHDALLVGGFYVALSDATSYASTRLGAALSCKPLAA